MMYALLKVANSTGRVPNMTASAATLPSMSKRQRRQPEPKVEDQGSAWVMVSARLPTAIAHALKLAAAKRQVEGKSPNSQQDIIGAAVTEWLRRNGHL